MNKRVLSLTLLLACLGLMTMQAKGRKVESFNSGWSFKKACLVYTSVKEETEQVETATALLHAGIAAAGIKLKETLLPCNKSMPKN